MNVNVTQLKHNINYNTIFRLKYFPSDVYLPRISLMKCKNKSDKGIFGE